MKKNWDNPIEHAMPSGARVPASVSIGGVRVAPATVLAPMAGVTDTVFRRFIRNASLFTHTDGLPHVSHLRKTHWMQTPSTPPSPTSNPAADSS